MIFMRSTAQMDDLNYSRMSTTDLRNLQGCSQFPVLTTSILTFRRRPAVVIDQCRRQWSIQRRRSSSATQRHTAAGNRALWRYRTEYPRRKVLECVVLLVAHRHRVQRTIPFLITEIRRITLVMIQQLELHETYYCWYSDREVLLARLALIADARTKLAKQEPPTTTSSDSGPNHGTSGFLLTVTLNRPLFSG